MLRKFVTPIVRRSTTSKAAAGSLSMFARTTNTSSQSVATQQQRTSSMMMTAPAPIFSMRFQGTKKAEPEETKKQGAYLLDKADVLARVSEVVKNFEKVDASKVTPESHFINDLGLDSLDVVEVVMALEQEFVIDIPDHEAEKIQSIPDAVEYLASNPMAK
jgi:NADH dehydrogenase (ubiquinone) 1 alpha/beta subcomplex 1, acyl-carrier protein